VIPLDKVKYILNNNVINKPITPYNEIVIEFLEEFSKKLKVHPLSKLYPDILTLSFWCRKRNILKYKKEVNNKIGWGISFHITPSNVPINFAFSYIFALLSGNSAIVRLPSKHFAQVDIILDVLKKLFIKYPLISNMSCFIQYERDDNITTYFSNLSQIRVIWGGDESIANIKKLPTKPKLIDIVFADRYSISIMDSDKLTDFSNLAKKFYNDTYLMDQNGCSSPHFIFWLNNNKDNINKFYLALKNVVKKEYNLEYIMSMDKFNQICLDSLNLDIEFIKYDNYIYVVTLHSLPKKITNLRGKSGYFYQYFINDLDEIKDIINEKFQTLTYYGIDKNELKNFIFENNLLGIDRIVPVGMAFEMDIIWDGYDLIETMTRKIKVI